MAEQEKKILLTVDTGSSEKTVKSLKKDISDLKDVILNLEKGTDEYNSAVEQLQISQRELNEVQALTKKTAVALDGSYDALVHQMGLLRKEWRATNDEAQRSELGKRIDEINTQLKELDATTGNHQRNVGNYEESIVNAYQRIRKEVKEYQAAVLNAEEGTEEWTDAMNKLSSAQFQMRDMNEKSRYAVADFGEQLSNVSGIASGLVGGFSAVQGVMALCGAETANFEKTMIKLQSAMAIVQGLQGLEGIQDRIVGLTSSIKVATKAMGKGGWIGIIIAITTAIAALITHLTIKNRKIKDGTIALQDYNKAAKENVSAYSEEIAKIRILEKYATDEAQSNEDRIKAAKKLLGILGEEVTETNAIALANGEYAKSIDKVTEKLVQQARMEGALELIKEKQKEIIEQQAEVNERMADSPNWWDKAQSIALSGGINGTGESLTDEDFKNNAVEREKKKLEQMKADFKVYANNLFKDFSIDDVLLGLSETGDTQTKATQKVLTVAEALKLAYSEVEKGLDSLDFNLDIKVNDNGYIKTIDDKNKKLKESAQYQIKLAENTAKNEKQILEQKKNQELAYIYQTITDTETLNKEVLKIEKKYADEEYLIDVETKEKQLAILYDWKAKNTDERFAVLEIAQMIADLEVEIETDKWNRIQEEAKEANEESRRQADETKAVWEDNWENFKDNWDDADWSGKLSMATDITAQAFSNTADILNSLADMYEADGEMSEQQAKKVKNLRIATATMDMLTGIVGAISSAAPLGPVGWAMGALQASSIAIMGAANIKKIKSTNVNGSSSSSGSASVTPNIGSYSSEIPASYTRNITTSSEMDEMNKEQRVVLVESDMVDALNRVQIRENESSF